MNSEEDIFVQHRDFFMTFREALLSVVNALELKLGISPTTSDMRREFKKKQLAQMDKQA